jgi:hypothetical protein
MSKTTNKFSPEVRARAVRMILDHEGDYPSRWSAVVSVADKVGCAPQTLHNDITPCWTTFPWPRNLNQMASGNPGAVQPLSSLRIRLSRRSRSFSRPDQPAAPQPDQQAETLMPTCPASTGQPPKLTQPARHG